MSQTVVLITGANRGIGRSILELYLQRLNHTVIAATRDPTHPTSQTLNDLPRAEGTELLVIKIDATSPTDPASAANELSTKGIKHVDVLIANAGISLSWPRVSDLKVAELQEHMEVNVYGFLYLYQAFRGLLKQAKEPKWISIGSSAACLTIDKIAVMLSAYLATSYILTLHRNFIPMRNASYAPTKAVVHWYTKAISAEDEWLNAFIIDPGWVQTDMGNRGAEAYGTERSTLTAETSASGIVNVVDSAERPTHSGKLFMYTGQEQPW